MTKSEQINELAAALSKAQGMMKPALKDTDNPFYKHKYADLSSCWDACRDALSANGLSIVQIPEEGGVTSILMHTSGQWMSGHLPMVPTKNDPQGVGSAITYARRYALCGFAGIAPEDDDGNAASGKDKEVKRTTEMIPLPPRPNASMVQSLSEVPNSSLVTVLQKSVAAVAEQKTMKPQPKPVAKKPTPGNTFHIQFKQALPERYRVFSDQLLVDWLNLNYPEYGGHTASIPMEELDDRLREAKKYAGSYEGQG